MMAHILWAHGVYGVNIHSILPYEFGLYYQVYNSAKLVCAMVEMHDSHDRRIGVVAVTTDDALSLEDICRQSLEWLKAQGQTVYPPVHYVGSTSEGHSQIVIDRLSAGYGGHLIDLSQPEGD